MTLSNIAWVAGLVEGEGNIGAIKSCPRIKVVMTDQDVIQKLATFWKHEHRLATSRPGHKQAYTTGIYGTKAAQWLMTLYPFLGQRRRAAAKQALHQWRSRAPRIKTCHPERRYYAKGLCQPCYLQVWRSKKR